MAKEMVAIWGASGDDGVKIGKFGKGIAFYCGTKGGDPKALGLSDFRRTTSMEFEEHEKHGGLGWLEYIKRNIDEISLTATLDASLGVKPRKTEKAIRELMVKHKARPLYIGGYRIGKFKWVIESMDVSYDLYSHEGKPIKITIELAFKEYRTKKKDTETTDKSNATKKKTSNVTRTAKKKTYATYTTVKGDTCMKVAKTVYGKQNKYKKIYNANKSKIKDINKTIAKGTELKIPLPVK